MANLCSLWQEVAPDPREQTTEAQSMSTLYKRALKIVATELEKAMHYDRPYDHQRALKALDAVTQHHFTQKELLLALNHAERIFERSQ